MEEIQILESLVKEVKDKQYEDEAFAKTLSRLNDKRRALEGQLQVVEDRIQDQEERQERCREKLRNTRTRIRFILGGVGEGLRVRSLNDIHILTSLWKLGFRDFAIQKEPSISMTEARDMHEAYGREYSFVDWCPEFKKLSSDKLEEEIEYFEEELQNESSKGVAAQAIRMTIFSDTVGALKGEKSRREIKAQGSNKAQVHNVDHWLARKD